MNYDYHDNHDPVPSDIADWSPEGIGVKTPVSATTWGEHAYPWPQGTWLPGAWERNEAHWYIYWMQSMPGRGNTIPYGADGMENWWRFTGNWDGSIQAGAGLEVSHLKPIALRTARDAVRTLKGQVAALVAAGKLSVTDARALEGRLDSAAQLLDGGVYADGHPSDQSIPLSAQDACREQPCDAPRCPNAADRDQVAGEPDGGELTASSPGSRPDSLRTARTARPTCQSSIN